MPKSTGWGTPKQKQGGRLLHYVAPLRVLLFCFLAYSMHQQRLPFASLGQVRQFSPLQSAACSAIRSFSVLPFFRQVSSLPRKVKVKMSSSAVYFGGSRHLGRAYIVQQVVRAVIQSGCSVHVGCQSGADQQVVQEAISAPSSLVVFAVQSLGGAPKHVRRAARAGAQVIQQAGGGQEVPINARYLLRSVAAFKGCEQAVFFEPGPGSLAVARECVKSGIPVFAIGKKPQAIPSQAGQWQPAQFFGFPCWQFQPAQIGLF